MGQDQANVDGNEAQQTSRMHAEGNARGTRLIAFLSDGPGQSLEMPREEAFYIPSHSVPASTALAAVSQPFCGICKDAVKTM